MVLIEAREPVVRPDAARAFGGRLRARIVNLETSVQRLELLEKAVHRIGIQGWNGPMAGVLAREAEETCLACTHVPECRRWLNGASPPDAYRAFCPNEALFALMAQPAAVALRAPSDGTGLRKDRLTRRAAAALSSLCHRTAPQGRHPNGDTFYPSADDLKRLRAENLRREVRALIDGAF
ncbi:DUF6455 family protein [Reyranella sp.]|uniref:DUF6455 family protein n=2 Tax=Reyranella sp. TaxID=1929291 RepID=UPI003D0EE74C